jgi:hypothetical protein
MYLDNCLCRKKMQITKALLKAQESFEIIEANFTNPLYKSKYAKLPDLYNATKKPLRANNILIDHFCTFHPITHQQTVKTVLWHTPSGEVLEDERLLIPEKPGSQGLGSAETYVKKYGLKSLLGTDVGEEDDDGESERLYISRLKNLTVFIDRVHKEFADATKQAILDKFMIKELKELGDGRLFDAVFYAMEFMNKNKDKYKDKK